MRQRAAASLLYQSQYAEPVFRNLQNLIFLKIVGRILAFYTEILTILHQDLPKLLPVAETIKRDIESGKYDDLLAKNFK